MFFGGFVRNDVDGSNNQPKLDTEVLMSWVAHDPVPRAKRLASLVAYCETIRDDGELAWTAITNRLIMASPDPVMVLEEFADRFYSGVSSGPFSSVRATIDDCDWRAIRLAKKRYRIADDGAPDDFALLQLGGPGRNVPEVANKCHLGFLVLIVIEK